MQEFQPKEGTPAQRFLEWYAWLDGLIRSLSSLSPQDKPVVGYEKVRRHQGTKAAHAYGAYQMALWILCEINNLSCYELEVAAIKKHATGKGNAPKDKMIQAAEYKMHLRGITDNEADAFWVADLLDKKLNIGDNSE